MNAPPKILRALPVEFCAVCRIPHSSRCCCHALSLGRWLLEAARVLQCRGNLVRCLRAGFFVAGADGTIERPLGPEQVVDLVHEHCVLLGVVFSDIQTLRHSSRRPRRAAAPTPP